MIDFAELVRAENVQIFREVTSRKSALETIARLLAKEETLDWRKIASAMLSREQLGSTALDDLGVAIPHCRLKECNKPVAALLGVENGVKFGAETVDIIFALVVPEKATQDHLNILSVIVKSFMNSENLVQMRKSRSSSELHENFHHPLAELTHQ